MPKIRNPEQILLDEEHADDEIYRLRSEIYFDTYWQEEENWLEFLAWKHPNYRKYGYLSDI